jgi:deoxyribodipyrimidine photolyase-related protein
MLHRASMKYYYDYLKKNKYKCKYIEFNKKFPLKEYTIFDPIDKIKLPNNPEIIESPNFLMTKELYQKHRDKTDKFFFNAFYMWSKKQLNILPNLKSQDKLNRKKLPKDIKIPPLPSNKADQKYINEAAKYIEHHFPKNYGNTDNFMFPISHKTANTFLISFIKNKLTDFGPYQDAISKDNNTLFHSILSSSINIGLINPTDVVDEILKVNAKYPINSIEGFIRQLFWREYQRYCYIYYDFSGKNYFGNKKKLTKDWYNDNGNLPEPVQDAVARAFETGYLHHIERLMIVGNYMNLSEIKPHEGFKWFMEFAIDSYEWVMHQNVYDMVFFVSGGATMRRPYVSSSNYILKMSNYKKGEWSETWKTKYQDFIKKHKKKLYKFRYYFRL